MNKLTIILLVVATAMAVSCKKDGFEKNATTATLKHEGFDFSANSTSGSIDGEVISWYPGSGSNPNYSSGAWWRNDQGGVNNEQAHLGAVDPESITSIPSSWDDPIDPLLPDHVYIFKCIDGYALVKVLSVNATDMSAEVEYVFSSNGEF